MSRFARVTTFLALLIITIVSPVRAAFNQGSFAGYPSRYSDFAYKVGWQTAQDKEGVVIDGVLKNLRYGYVDSLVLAVWLVDRDGKVIARDMTFTIPQRMTSSDYRTFSLKLANATLAKGETLQFLLWSSGSEGGNGGFSWLTSFAVDASTGAVLGAKETKNPDDW